jgi:hypothetical protein
MTTMERLGGVAHDVQDQLDAQISQFSRWMKPYRKQVSRLSHDLRPYGEQALDFARKNPGKTVAGALALGYLLARLGRR